eukprot:gene1325-426_t
MAYLREQTVHSVPQGSLLEDVQAVNQELVGFDVVLPHSVLPRSGKVPKGLPTTCQRLFTLLESDGTGCAPRCACLLALSALVSLKALGLGALLTQQSMRDPTVPKFSIILLVTCASEPGSSPGWDDSAKPVLRILSIARTLMLNPPPYSGPSPPFVLGLAQRSLPDLDSSEPARYLSIRLLCVVCEEYYSDASTQWAYLLPEQMEPRQAASGQQQNLLALALDGQAPLVSGAACDAIALLMFGAAALLSQAEEPLGAHPSFAFTARSNRLGGMLSALHDGLIRIASTPGVDTCVVRSAFGALGCVAYVAPYHRLPKSLALLRSYLHSAELLASVDTSSHVSTDALRMICRCYNLPVLKFTADLSCGLTPPPTMPGRAVSMKHVPDELFDIFEEQNLAHRLLAKALDHVRQGSSAVGPALRCVGHVGRLVPQALSPLWNDATRCMCQLHDTRSLDDPSATIAILNSTGALLVSSLDVDPDALAGPPHPSAASLAPQASLPARSLEGWNRIITAVVLPSLSSDTPAVRGASCEWLHASSDMLLPLIHTLSPPPAVEESATIQHTATADELQLPPTSGTKFSMAALCTLSEPESRPQPRPRASSLSPAELDQQLCVIQENCVHLWQQLLQLTSDPNSAVKARAAQAIGSWVVSDCLLQSPDAIKEVVHAMQSMSSDTEPVPVQANSSWAVANLCNSLRATPGARAPSGYPQMAAELVALSLSLSSRQHKVRCNAARALGNMLAFVPANLLASQPPVASKQNDAAGPTCCILCAVLSMMCGTIADSHVKSRWNACYSLGSALQNPALATFTADDRWDHEHCRKTISDSIQRLCEAITLDQNFKALFARGNLGIMWASVMQALQGCDNTSSFQQYQMAQPLRLQLHKSLLHLVAVSVDPLKELVKPTAFEASNNVKHPDSVALDKVFQCHRGTLSPALQYLEDQIASNDIGFTKTLDSASGMQSPAGSAALQSWMVTTLFKLRAKISAYPEI